MRQNVKKISIILVLIIAVLQFSACGSYDVQSRLSSYEIIAKYDDASHSVTGEMTVNYLNCDSVAVSGVCFSLPPNGFREGAKYFAVSPNEQQYAYPNGLSYGDITITGCDLPYEIGGEDKNMLTVQLESAVLPGDSVEVKMHFITQLANVKHRLGYTDRVVNLGNWFPLLCPSSEGRFVGYPYYSSGDPFFSDVADFKVTLNVPIGYIVAATGNVVAQSSTVTYKANSVRDFAVSMSKYYNVIEKKVGNTAVKYYFIEDAAAAQHLDLSAKAVQTFSSLFGKYPYDTLSVVQTEFLQGGMEYPNIVFISDIVEQSQYKKVIVHEIAHQWWYGVVGNDQVTAAYLDEGLTEYSTALFFDQRPEYGVSLSDMRLRAKQSYNAYLRLTTSFNITPDERMNRHLDEFNSATEYVVCSYDKGFMLFDAVRAHIGYDNFIAVLKEYYKKNAYKVAEIKDFYAAVMAQTKVDYSNLMSGYIEGRVKIA